ncbi:ABC transporter permease [Pseudoalteromonas xiamenensis]
MSFYPILKQVIAGLRKNPTFSVTMILTLALTLGALLAAINLNQVVLFKPLPYKSPEQLYLLQQNLQSEGKNNIGGQLEAPQVAMYKQAKESNQSAAMIKQQQDQVTSDASQPVESALYVTPEYFSLLGLPLHLGNDFSPSAWYTEALPEVVLSYEYWQRQYAGSPAVIGQTLEFNKIAYRIIGVMADKVEDPAPSAPYGPAALYLPMSNQVLNDQKWTNASKSLTTIQRINTPNLVQSTQAQFTNVMQQTLANHSDIAKTFDGYQLLAHFTPLEDAIRGDSARITIAVFAGAITLLVIALANIINLYLSHLIKQQQTLAICASIGAKPKQLFTRIFLEASVLTITASALGLLVAAWLLELTKSLAKESVHRLVELGLNWQVSLVALVCALLLALILAFFAKNTIRYHELKSHLSGSGKGTQKQISPQLRNGLIASQVAFTGVMLIASSSVLHSALSLANHPLGVDVTNTYSAQIVTAGEDLSKDGKMALINEVQQKLNNHPKIDQTARSFVSPIRRGNFSSPLVTEDGQHQGVFGFNAVDENYFPMLKQTVISGRNFSPDEIVDKAKVIIVSKALALQVFGTTEVIGKRLGFRTENLFEIVGVVDDHYNAFTHSQFTGYLYWPYSTLRLNLMIRTKSGQTLSRKEVIDLVNQVNSNATVLEFLNVAQTSDELVFHHKLAAALSSGLSILALGLACAGIFGVVSYGTQMRRFELGVRMALGAKPKRVLAMVVKEALKPLLTGVIVAFLLSAGCYTVFNELFVTYAKPQFAQVAIAIAVLFGFCYLACVIPVKQIIKADPISALRNE